MYRSHEAVADVTVDPCPKRGSFFDRDEVRTLVDARRRARRRQSPGLGNLAFRFVAFPGLPKDT
jgi:hypothetical protein